MGKINKKTRRGLFVDERDRVLASVKESVEEAGNKSEFSAYYFVIGLSFAIFIGLIIIVANIKSKTNQLAVYSQKIKDDVDTPLQKLSSQQGQVKYLDTQVVALKMALMKRIDFAAFIGNLTEKQYKNSKWTSFSISSQSVTLEMEAGNFDDMGKSVKAFEQVKGVKKAEVSEVSLNPDTSVVTYKVELQMDFTAYKVQGVQNAAK